MDNTTFLIALVNSFDEIIGYAPPMIISYAHEKSNVSYKH
jgi:hypothetical protein